MEQSSGKTERLMLAAGLALALGVAAWQYFSPASRQLMAARDVSLALLGERSSVFLVYHPFSSTVNAFILAHPRAKPGVSGWHRAVDLSQAAGIAAEGGNVFYIALSSAPNLDAFKATLDNWRASPRLLPHAVSWVRQIRASGATNLSPFDSFSLFSEFSKLNSSNFIFTELSRRSQAAEAESEENPAPAPLVEIFNASGRKGLAALAAKRLRVLGFDVITETSYPTIEKKTSILSFSRDTAAARRLREALGLNKFEIRVRPSEKSVAGAAVVLGQDFEEKKLGK